MLPFSFLTRAACHSSLPPCPEAATVASGTAVQASQPTTKGLRALPPPLSASSGLSQKNNHHLLQRVSTFSSFSRCFHNHHLTASFPKFWVWKNKVKLGNRKLLAKVEEQDGRGCPFQTHLPGTASMVIFKMQVQSQVLKFIWVCTHVCVLSCTSLFTPCPFSHSGMYSLLCMHTGSQISKGLGRAFMKPFLLPPLRAFLPRWYRTLDNCHSSISWIKEQALWFLTTYNNRYQTQVWVGTFPRCGC